MLGSLRLALAAAQEREPERREDDDGEEPGGDEHGPVGLAEHADVLPIWAAATMKGSDVAWRMPAMTALRRPTSPL